MSLGQDIFTSFLGHLWGFIKEEYERWKVSGMDFEQLRKWRTEKFAEINQKAIRLAGFTSDKELRKRDLERTNLVRNYEVLLRNELGVRMSQHLLADLDIRGLDLRDVRGLSQQQIEHAIGDATTQLPDYLHTPPAWRGKN